MGVFADDTFRLGDRLTLNLGLRYDHSKASLPDAPVLDSLGNPTGETVRGIDSVYHLELGLSAAGLCLQAQQERPLRR